MCNFSVCVNRTFTANNEKREESCFIDCTAWGKTGEIINEHMRKGSTILCDGRIRQESWDDKQTGAKRSKLTMVVESFQFAGPKPSDDGNAPPRGNGSGSYPRDKQSARSAPQTSPPFDDNDPEFDSDIPFTSPTA